MAKRAAGVIAGGDHGASLLREAIDAFERGDARLERARALTDLGAQLRDFATPRDQRAVDVSLHLVEVPDARAFGCVPTDDSGRVTAFVEKSDSSTSTSSTVALLPLGCAIEKAFRRPMMMPRSL